LCLFRNLATLILLLSRLNRSIFSWQQIPYKISCITSRTASVTGELQSQVPVTWLSLHFWWKMTFNPSLKIHRFTINEFRCLANGRSDQGGCRAKWNNCIPQDIDTSCRYDNDHRWFPQAMYVTESHHIVLIKFSLLNRTTLTFVLKLSPLQVAKFDGLVGCNCST
jgi:hypothetical protein